MKRNHFIIHGFALMHLLIAMLFHNMGWQDDYIMTVLTMSMVFLLTFSAERSSAEAAMLSLIYICVGYFVGSQFPELLHLTFPVLNPVLCNAITTFILTELFGWLLVLILASSITSPQKLDWSRSNLWSVMLLFLVVMLYRIIYVDLVRWASLHSHTTLYRSLMDYGSHTLLIIITTVACFFLMRSVCVHFPYREKPVWHFAFILLISTLMAALSTAFLKWENLTILNVLADYCQLLVFFSAAGFCNLFACTVFSLVISYIIMFRQLQQEVGQRHQAQYQYHQLKQQLNPHFLFNCLNILDYIVQSGEQDHASQFIRKLAGIYRYQLSMGDVRKVQLAEELKHVSAYVELLQERFGQAFQTEVSVPRELMDLDVVPCSIQLMVENAQKHNIVNQNNPLRVKIYTEGIYLCVSNNIQERRSKPESTGIGLKNIQQQYADLTTTPVQVLNDGNVFIVKLPML